MRYFASVAVTLCVLCAHTVSAQPATTTSHASVFEFKDCTQQTQRMLARTYAQLPTAVRESTSLPLHIHCSAVNLPFGFSVHTQHETQILRLGSVAPGAPRRPVYRLAHLSDIERAQLWHQRGLVHLLLLNAVRRSKWHLDAQFRQINDWNEEGTSAKNLDSWAYARPLGQHSALYDLVTFGEEWFIRPPRRPKAPDNRVECQSLSKGRFFTQLFDTQSPDLPPKHCAQFWAWNAMHHAAEVLFTAPTRSPISSFGHLALLLRSSESMQPEYVDPVYQFVGLVSIENGRKSIGDSLLSEVPMVLQTSDFVSFDRQTRLREDRAIHRFPITLSEPELIWLKARLWEQVRRFEADYHFMTENCAEMILKLFRGISPDRVHSQAGLSTSPMGVLSILRQAGVIGSTTVRQASLTDELSLLENKMTHYIELRTSHDQYVPSLTPLTADRLAGWMAFLNTLTPADTTALPFLHHAQDYFDLAVWRPLIEPIRLIPVKPPEILALKHELLHEEKFAQDVARRIREWQQMQQELTSTDRPTQRERLETLTTDLTDAIGEKINEIGVGVHVHSPLETSTKIWNGKQLIRAWGSDSSGFMSVDTTPHFADPVGRLKFVLYHERQGDHRSLMRAPNRDLELLSLTLASDLHQRLNTTLTPLALYLRSGTFGLSRLGSIFKGSFGYIDEVLSASASVGTSVQLARWWADRGDLSIGIRADAQAATRSQTSTQTPCFASLTVPLWSHSFLRSDVWQNAWRTDAVSAKHGFSLELEVGVSLADRQVLSAVTTLNSTHHHNQPDVRVLSLGLRIQ